MQCFDIDFIGSLPDAAYILAIIFTFARWVRLHRTPAATAIYAAAAPHKFVLTTARILLLT